jgi:hypothetical protein
MTASREASGEQDDRDEDTTITEAGKRSPLSTSGRGGSGRPARRGCASGTRPYLIESYTLNSGMYIEITMKPTMPPTRSSMIGSRIEVSDLTDVSTWSS